MDEHQNSQPNLPHAPGEVINPGTQQTIQSNTTATQASTPTPQQQAVESVNLPTQIQTQTSTLPTTEPGMTEPFNLSDIPDQKDRKNLAKKLAIPGVIILIILIGLGVAINQGILMPNRLKSIQYTNDKGSKYSLNFYAAHSVKKLSENFTKESSDLSTTSLVAKHGQQGKYPLALSLWSNEVKPAASSSVENCKGMQKIMSVYNAYADKEVNVCSRTSNDSSEAIYLAYLKKGDKAVLALFIQDWDTKSIKDKESAHKFLNSVGLTVYDQDIKQIVASIKPLD